VTSRRGAVFLDRDGVLNERPAPHRYVTRPDELRWLPGAAEAVARLCRAGLPILVVSNQRGVARGLVSADTLVVLEAVLQRELARHGGRVTAFYYCTHELDDACDCRKPAPGLLVRAAQEHEIALSESVVVGDAESDVEAGRAADCRTIRIAPAGTPSEADSVIGSLAEATALILGER
jgi:D-glycero-D-manno-heptose 1,7-bisphosphate phosphatase